MTPTEKARRVDALYQCETKHVLAEMVVHREADLEDAKAEGEHMRLKALAVAGELQEESERLKAENAKLRELVRELWFYAEQELVCDSTCQYGAVCDWRDCVFRRSMRELGVEVDE